MLCAASTFYFFVCSTQQVNATQRNRKNSDFIREIFQSWHYLFETWPGVRATNYCTGDLTSCTEESSYEPFWSVRRRPIWKTRIDRTVRICERQSNFCAIFSHPRTVFGHHSACGDAAEKIPETGAYSHESGRRLTTAFEGALSGIDPDRWFQVTREMCPIRVDLSEHRNLSQMIKAFGRGQAAINMMPRQALTPCIGGFISLASIYVRRIENYVKASYNKCETDLFEQDVSSLINLALGQPMVFLITWKAKSSSVAQIWVRAAHAIATYAVTTENEPLTRIVTEAFHQAQHFAVHWLTCTELQYKIVSFLSYAIAAIPSIGDEAKNKPAAIMRWLSIVEILHTNDVGLIVAVRALRHMMLGFHDDADFGIMSTTAFYHCIHMQSPRATRAAMMLQTQYENSTRTQFALFVDFRSKTLMGDCGLSLHESHVLSEGMTGGLVSPLTDGSWCTLPPTRSPYEEPD